MSLLFVARGCCLWLSVLCCVLRTKVIGVEKNKKKNASGEKQTIEKASGEKMVLWLFHIVLFSNNDDYEALYKRDSNTTHNEYDT